MSGESLGPVSGSEAYGGAYLPEDKGVPTSADGRIKSVDAQSYMKQQLFGETPPTKSLQERSIHSLKPSQSSLIKVPESIPAVTTQPTHSPAVQQAINSFLEDHVSPFSSSPEQRSEALQQALASYNPETLDSEDDEYHELLGYYNQASQNLGSASASVSFEEFVQVLTNQLLDEIEGRSAQPHTSKSDVQKPSQPTTPSPDRNPAPQSAIQDPAFNQKYEAEPRNLSQPQASSKSTIVQSDIKLTKPRKKPVDSKPLRLESHKTLVKALNSQNSPQAEVRKQLAVDYANHYAKNMLKRGPKETGQKYTMELLKAVQPLMSQNSQEDLTAVRNDVQRNIRDDVEKACNATNTSVTGDGGHFAKWEELTGIPISRQMDQYSKVDTTQIDDFVKELNALQVQAIQKVLAKEIKKLGGLKDPQKLWNQLSTAIEKDLRKGMEQSNRAAIERASSEQKKEKLRNDMEAKLQTRVSDIKSNFFAIAGSKK